MAGTKIRGKQMLLNLGGGKLGCLTSVTFNLEREIVEASCREDGMFTTGTKGNLSGSIDFDGLVIIDDPAVEDNIRSNDLIDTMLDDSDTEVDYVSGPGSATGGDVDTMGTPGDIAGSKVLTGTAILSSFSISGDQDGEATYSGSLTLTSKPVHAVAV